MTTAVIDDTKLGIEFNDTPDPNATCVGCSNPFDDMEVARFVAVVYDTGAPTAPRVCQDCADALKPGLWEIAEGMDQIFDGLIGLPIEDRAGVAGRLVIFLDRLLGVVPGAIPYAPSN